jgi:signal transduction histidine kinase/CheY-like chemotaxis protein
MVGEALKFLEGDGVMPRAIRAYDWAATPLGPIDDWPDVLKTTVALTLGSQFPQAIIWGEGLTTLYNDAFIPILGGKRDALGRAFSDVWSEAWDALAPIAEAAFAGRATYIEDFPLSVRRGDLPEQAYFTFCYSPIRDEEGVIVGMLDTVTETTATVTANRRLAFLDELSRTLSDAADAETILAVTTRRVVEHLSLSNCAYADMDPDEDGFTIRGDWAAPGSPSIVGHYSLKDFGVLAVERLGAGLPLIVNDNLAELAPSEAATFQAIGIAATICMPLVRGGQLTALMAIHDRQPRLWSSYELALITEVTERSWAHIERVRSNAELQASAQALSELNATLELRVVEEVSERRRAEETLRHTQKLEAIGQLTGGVAHDFNNLLTIIRSSADLLRTHDLDAPRRRRYVDAISDTADRAARLTSQLLSFSRRQALSAIVFDACARVVGVSDMLRTLLGARIRLEVRAADEACLVEADPNEFETALVNLAVNARDAMDGEGVLTIEVGPVDGLPSIRGHAAAPVSATRTATKSPGAGIAPGDLDRIFEPFFTTKEIGRGTGLGLSQVFGFSKQSGGEVEAVSSPGEGARFSVYLPRAAHLDEGGAPSLQPPAARPRGRVLLVEDNIQIGEFAAQLLGDLGHEVERVTNAADAMKRLVAGARFDVVFSDVVMPGTSGLDMARNIRERWPDLPVLLTSGYSHVLAQDARHGFPLLRKPYSVEELSKALRQALARAA